MAKWINDMQLEVTQYTVSNSVFYRVTMDGVDPDVEYRARLFLYYAGVQSYSGEEGSGLTTNIFGTFSDDWSCEFRPPRIDDHKFNTELNVPLSIGRNDIGFSGRFDGDSESYISNAVNPVNLLVERKVSEIRVNRIFVTNKAVFLDLDGDVEDGVAICVENTGLAERHLLGPNGMRICGNYRVRHVSDHIYTYDVKHYVDVPSAEIQADGYVVSIWEAVDYRCGAVELVKVDNEHAKFSYDGGSYFVKPGDNVLLGKYSCRVSSVAGNTVTVEAVMGDNNVTVPLAYSPRTPSGAVPVNWPIVITSSNRSSIDSVEVDNACSYDHTQNTAVLNPTVITYFTMGDDSLHANEPVAVASRGERTSLVCMKFAANSIKAENPSAELHMYVDSMDVSEATIVLYQMTSDGWNELMTYDQVMGFVTNIPVGNKVDTNLNPDTLKNPAMLHVNTASTIVNAGDYGSWVRVKLDSDVVEQWMDGNVSYAPSFAVRVVGEGTQTISFSTKQYAPHIIITGGEGDEFVPFAIKLSTDTIEHGQVLRITPDDPVNHNFGNSVFSNSVEIGGYDASIVSGDATYIDAIIPDTVSGSSVVMVYRKVSSSGDRVAMTDGNTSVYVSTALASRNVKLAKKLTPGVIDVDRVGHYAIYNRDFGFVNMKEVTDENSMLQNVYSILLTNPGERLFNNDFGTGIEQRLFTLGSEEDGIDLIKECIQKVSMYEPRVYIDGDQSSCEFDESENKYVLLLCVVLPSGTTETIQLPFKNRGREV